MGTGPWSAVTLVALALTSQAVAAQRCPPNEVTEWQPRSLRTSPPSLAAERASVEATFRAAEAIARKTAYGQPRGFTVTPIWQYGDEPERHRLRRFAFGTQISHDCRGYDESGADIWIEFNTDPRQWSTKDMPAEDGVYYYWIGRHREPRFGSLAAFGRSESDGWNLTLLFTTGGVSPTIPVTREEYLRAAIFGLEGKNGAQLKETQMARRKSYQDWLDGAPERKKQNERIIAMIANQDPAQAAKTRAEMETAEKGAGEELKRLADEERDHNAAAMTEPGDKLRAQIAAMTAAERASPAWIRDGLYEFVPAGAPNAYEIVRENPEFYRRRQSSVEVRLILVSFQNVPVARKAQREQMFRDFDWEALKRLLQQ